MDFAGREELILKCSDLIDSLKPDFEKFTKQLAKSSPNYIDNNNLKDLSDIVLDNLLVKNLDKEFILKNLDSCIGDKIFARYFLSAAFVHLYHSFCFKLKKNNENLLYCTDFFGIALENFLSIFDDYPKTVEEETHKNIFHSSSPSFIFGSVTDEMKNLCELDQKVEFLNLYKGVAVRSFAKILKIEDENAIFILKPLQLAAMLEERHAFILKNKNLSCNVKADPKRTNLKRKLVELSNFTRFNKMFASQRKFSRVHPNKLTKVTLSDKGGNFIEGKLFDISQGGIGVVSSVDAHFEKGEELLAKFTLFMPKTNEEIEVELIVTLVISLNYQGSIRYCCQICKPQKITQEIIEFSRAREEEIINELEKIAADYE